MSMGLEDPLLDSLGCLGAPGILMGSHQKGIDRQPTRWDLLSSLGALGSSFWNPEGALGPLFFLSWNPYI